jgi:magnesium-transporting ATPase (P-type)
MVTGDNVLTAISVARSCHIVHSNQRIFLGDINEKNPNLIVWKDFDLSENVLDPETLEPSSNNNSFINDNNINFYDPESTGPSP